jgi:hypothetical protein
MRARAAHGGSVRHLRRRFDDLFNSQPVLQLPQGGNPSRSCAVRVPEGVHAANHEPELQKQYDDLAKRLRGGNQLNFEQLVARRQWSILSAVPGRSRYREVG